MDNLVRFTVRPLIQKEESLFGFLLRFANANGISLCDILNRLKVNKYRLHSGDYHKLDIIPESMIDLRKLCFVSGSLIEELKSSTCYNIILKFKGNSKDYNSMFLKEYLRNEFHYCPDCLKEKRIIHLLWKFEPIVICEKHQRILLDSCHFCHKRIKYNDLREVGSCPYCLKDLSKQSSEVTEVITNQVILEQRWYRTAFDSLLNKYSGIRLDSSELALKILYVINGCINEFNRKEIRNKFKETTLVHFLQCARGTTKKRTIHIRTILSILKDRDITVETFLTMELPNEFKAAVLNHEVNEKHSLKCIAPWCMNYDLEGRLLATTSKNIQQLDQTLKQYFVCPDCSCEYALNSRKEMIERTYFIRAFEILSNRSIDNLTWPEKEKIIGLKRNRILRIIAYFSSRGLLTGNYRYTEKDIDDTLLLKAIESIQTGSKIHDIQHFDCWDNNEHYLLHRYHPQVVKAIVSKKHSLSPKFMYDKDLSREIENVCHQLIKKGQEIKIGVVAKLIGYSATTIRNKGCSSIINKYRKQQQIIYKQNLLQRVQDNVNNYFTSHEGQIIHSRDLFNEFEVCRNTIKRIDPEYCKQIDQRRSNWNEQLKLTM
ncbi:TniQ family protein [Paenibacillus zanthoxyli]|uniref:TniQ family protein n=1 Tax=Paenibacillus zanthoxyli TaxID=369399 RepID=UPI00046EA5C9|nr:TniQ family protein [Paenibacillus zanthoxyli]